jgi:metallo-beta-lactamase family protein
MSIRLGFHGASGAVTGSCFLLETGAAKILIDCGMFQGPKSERELNYRPFAFDPHHIDAVLLTHAHVDHSGLLPKLMLHGFGGPILATQPTIDLCGVMLPDCGNIQETEVEQLNRRNQRRGRDPVTPIYTEADAVACLRQFRPVKYGAWASPCKGIRARYWNAGHLLGSASIEIEVQDPEGSTIRFLASGDIGPESRLLHPDPHAPRNVDYVLCESTYGDRDRIEVGLADRRRALLAEVAGAARSGGALLIPSFAVERTQELLADLVALLDSGELPPTQIFIDSPLATRVTEVFSRHAASLSNGAALMSALRSPHLRFTSSVEESKAIDRLSGFHIVIAGSGMAEAGRIRHHLKARLWSRQTTVLFVGFQAEGTLGRILLGRAPVVRIQGEEVRVQARIRSLDLYSGHADGTELAAWIRARQPIRHQVFLVHGEQPALAGLAKRIEAFLPGEAIRIPRLDEIDALTVDGAILTAEGMVPRVDREVVGRPDSHNALSQLILDITEAVDREAHERAKAVVIRRIRRALEGTTDKGSIRP